MAWSHSKQIDWWSHEKSERWNKAVNYDTNCISTHCWGEMKPRLLMSEPDLPFLFLPLLVINKQIHFRGNIFKNKKMWQSGCMSTFFYKWEWVNSCHQLKGTNSPQMDLLDKVQLENQGPQGASKAGRGSHCWKLASRRGAEETDEPLRTGRAPWNWWEDWSGRLPRGLQQH